MSYSDWVLSAHAVDPFDNDLYLVKRNTPLKRAWVYRVIPGSLPVLVTSSILIPQSRRFPYGEDVDPD